MSESVDTLVIGAGQAGLALSQRLTSAGHEHLVVDRGRIAERWRSERWDSFRLLSPNWSTRLPGFEYEGDDPDGFMDRDGFVRHVERYARSFRADVRTGVDVTALRRGPQGWRATTATGSIDARRVVVATGSAARPRVPAVAADLPGDVHHLHTRDYRNPSELVPGGVLVVGAGPSGQQVARELAAAGRRVVIAVGRHRWLPRRYRGRDVYWWMDRLGMLRRTVDTLPGGRAPDAPSPVLTGGRHDLDLRTLHDAGVQPVGRLLGFDGYRAVLGTDLACHLAHADANGHRFRTAVDDHVRVTGMRAPVEDPPAHPLAWWADEAPTRLDLAAEGIATVVWATGFRPDWSWIDAPVFHADGDPIHRRGITPAAGLGFLGLRWQHTRASSFLAGVGADAVHLADAIVRSSRRPVARRGVAA